MIEVTWSLSSHTNIPQQLQDRCKPDDYIFRCLVQADNDSIIQLEKKAVQQTLKYEHICNDLGTEGICPTDTSRVVHALEHIIVCHLIQNGEIDIESALYDGDVALSVPGIGEGGQEIAAFWLRKGLVELKRIEEILLGVASQQNIRLTRT